MTKEIKNVWLISREFDKIAGAGGVKDVTKQLAVALAKKGIKSTVAMPYYKIVDQNKHIIKDTGIAFNVPMNYKEKSRLEFVKVFETSLEGSRIFLMESERYSSKENIYTYTEKEESQNPLHKRGTGHFDYFACNILLQKASLDLMMILNEKPDLVHCQDGHTACLPALMREIEGYSEFFNQTGAIITIHNAGFGYHQEVNDLPFAQSITDLPAPIIYDSILNGCFNPILCGSQYAIINTVSENYARELRETEDDAMSGWLGHILKERGIILEGISNGITPENFDPTDAEKMNLIAPYNVEKGDLEGKKQNKRQLIDDLKNDRHKNVRVFGNMEYEPETPLLTTIEVLAPQKGMDVMVAMLRRYYQEGGKAQTIILGQGDKAIEEALIKLAKAFEEKVMVCIGFDSELANKIYASGDFFIIPSKYEPCGITDYIAQLMGNLPIVHLVGGLVKVKDDFNGFGYTEHTPGALLNAVKRALKTFSDDQQKIIEMLQNAVKNIKENYTWEKIINNHYMRLYKAALVK